MKIYQLTEDMAQQEMVKKGERYPYKLEHLALIEKIEEERDKSRQICYKPE